MDPPDGIVIVVGASAAGVAGADPELIKGKSVSA